MWYQFFLENLHFAVNLGGALMFFAVFWLYFDAWLGRKTFKEFTRWFGFLLLSLSFLVGALLVESTFVTDPFLPQSIHLFVLSILRTAGYSMVIVSLMIDPLMEKPKNSTVAGVVFLPSLVISLIHPILASLCGLLYLRRATVGLENHLKPVAFTFFILSLAELLTIGYLLQSTSNTVIYNFVAPFGVLWIVQQVVVLIAVLVLRRWIFGYLLKRFQSQLFIIFTTAIVTIFLITTVAFSALLLKNMENESLAHLQTDVNILQYSVDSKKVETLSDAQVVAVNPEIQKAIAESDKKRLKELATSIFLSKKQSTLLILSQNGVVLARGEDPDRVGDSLSDDPVVKKALSGQSVSSVITKDGVLAPTVSIRSAVPISNGVGVVLVGTDIDNAFVDGVKKATKLDASIYADNIRSATTYLSADGKSRSIGIKEESPSIQKVVLSQGKDFAGGVTILNAPYLAAYVPLKDINNVTVGMLFVGRPQVQLLVAAGKSIELTFLIAVFLLIMSILPAYFIARYIANQIK